MGHSATVNRFIPAKSPRLTMSKMRKSSSMNMDTRFKTAKSLDLVKTMNAAQWVKDLEIFSRRVSLVPQARVSGIQSFLNEEG